MSFSGVNSRYYFFRNKLGFLRSMIKWFFELDFPILLLYGVWLLEVFFGGVENFFEWYYYYDNDKIELYSEI